MTLPEPIAVTLTVIEALNSLHVPYLLGGSFASAVYGVPRATMDADIVADLRLEHVDALLALLGRAFYFDADTMRHAIEQRSSFNLIHLQSMFKVDIFVFRGRPYDQAQMAHRVPQILDPEVQQPVDTASAEDTILAKLEWYRLGNEVSERQWRDVLGVLRVQAGRLDHAYLHRWAVELGLADLLARALAEAGH